MSTIDNEVIDEVTIDGEQVTEITMDGDVVWTADDILIVDDFSHESLSTHYVPMDTSNDQGLNHWTINSWGGDSYLIPDTTDGFLHPLMLDSPESGGNFYRPQRGDYIKWRHVVDVVNEDHYSLLFAWDGAPDNGYLGANVTNYRVTFSVSSGSDHIVIHKVDNNSGTSIASDTMDSGRYDFSQGDLMEVHFDFGHTNSDELVAKIYDENGTLEAEASAVDTDYNTGDFGFYSGSAGSGSFYEITNVHVDNSDTSPFL